MTTEYESLEVLAGNAAVAACGDLKGRVRRRPFAEATADRSSFKCPGLQKIGIPGRAFEVVGTLLEKKVTAIREPQEFQLRILVR